LAGLTDEQLVRARDETRRDLFFWQEAYASLGAGEWPLAMEPPDQALCLLLWAISRFKGPTDLREGLEAHAEPTPEMRAALRNWEALAPHLEQLRSEVPAFADALAPQRVMAASLDPQEAERHIAQLEDLIEKHADELRAFLQAHPEARQAFGLSLPEDELPEVEKK
jgi:soluble lytic murein transglycosylase-like protein